MKRWRSVVAAFLCVWIAVFSIFPPVTALDEIDAQKCIAVHFPDDSQKLYSVKIYDHQIMLSLEDLSEITGYDYSVDSLIAFYKENEYLTGISVDFTGNTQMMGDTFQMQILEENGEYYLPLATMLYGTHAVWSVKNDVLYVNPASSTILEFLGQYYNMIIDNKTTEADILLNGESKELRAIRSALVSFLRNLDGRYYVPGMTEHVVTEEYEELMMLLTQGDQEFLNDKVKQQIYGIIEESPFDSLLESTATMGFLSEVCSDVKKFVEIDSAGDFADMYLSNDYVCKKLSGEIEFSSINMESADDIIKTAGAAGDAMDFVSSFFDLVETVDWVNRIDDDLAEQLSTFTESDMIGYNVHVADNICAAAQNLINRKKGYNIVEIMDDWLGKVMDLTGSSYAGRTPAGKIVTAMQGADLIASTLSENYSNAMEVGELSYSLGQMVKMEYFAQSELQKIYLRMGPNSVESFSEKNVRKLRNAILLSIRLNMRTQSMLYQLNQMGNDDPNWEESEDAKQIIQKIAQDYALMVILESTVNMDKRIPLDMDGNKVPFNTDEEKGPVREPIPESIVKTREEMGPRLKTEQLKWIVEPTWDYETVEPIDGPAFSDIASETNFADGKTEFFPEMTFPFREMSFPLYSNLPEYYNVKKKDGSWQLFYMPDRVSSDELKQKGVTLGKTYKAYRYDCMGIDVDADGNYISSASQSSPWHTLLTVGRGGASGTLYWNEGEQTALFATSNFESTSPQEKPIGELGLHKPYPVQAYASVLVGGAGAVDSMWAYVAPDGTRITDFAYAKAGQFSDGLAACSVDGETWGYIDESGDAITAFAYEAVWEGYQPGDNKAFPCTDDTIVVVKDGQYGLLYRDGSVLIEFGELEALAPSWNDHLWAKQNGRWGLIDLNDAKRQGGLFGPLDDNESRWRIIQEDKNVLDEASGEEYYTVTFDRVLLEERTEACKKINRQIQAACIEFLSDPIVEKNKESAQAAYRAFGAFQHTAKATVKENNNILTITLDITDYLGGMHPLQQTEILNFNLKTGEKLELEDVFSISGVELRIYLLEQCLNYIEQNTDICWQFAEEQLKKSMLEKYPFYIQDGNAYIQFQQYELACGVAGCVSIPCKIK